jgi:glycosyltransferase involved in cell wall biosynthesis
MPNVTIIIPSYNHSDFLIDRLESIASQSYTDWEAIIIDDKSTDISCTIIEDFLKTKPNFNVKYFIVNAENSGSGYKSWQKGIELATTEFIWIAETDDYSNSGFLEEMITILENNPTTVLAFCNSNYVDRSKKYLYNSSGRTSVLKVEEKYKIFDSKMLLDSMPLNPLITNGSSVIFRKPLNAIPKEILQQKQISDLFLWSYLVKDGSFGFLNKNLNFFRRHEDSTTTKFEEIIFYSNYFKLSKERSKVIISYFAQNLFFSKKLFGNFESLSQLEIKYFYAKAICKIFIKKLIKYPCRPSQ